MGVVSGGIGSLFGPVWSHGLLGEIARAGTHGFFNGMLSELQGGSFFDSYAAGAFGSLGGSVFEHFAKGFAASGIGTVAFYSLSGGVGAALSGGDFWRGAGQGAAVSLLNHLAHRAIYPPKGFKGDYWEDEDGKFIRNADGHYTVLDSPEGIGMYQELSGVTVGAKSILNKLDDLTIAFNIGNSAKLGLIEYASKIGELDPAVLKYTKVMKFLGRASGIYTAGRSLYKFYNNPTTGSFAHLAFNAGIMFIRINPFVGVGIGILDATGVTNHFFRKIDNRKR